MGFVHHFEQRLESCFDFGKCLDATLDPGKQLVSLHYR